MWFLMGILIGITVLGLTLWIRGKNVKLTWYEWLLGIVGSLLLLFTIQNFAGLLTEVQSQAAWLMVVMIGLPAIILLGVTFQLVRRRNQAS